MLPRLLVRMSVTFVICMKIHKSLQCSTDYACVYCYALRTKTISQARPHASVEGPMRCGIINADARIPHTVICMVGQESDER